MALLEMSELLKYIVAVDELPSRPARPISWMKAATNRILFIHWPLADVKKLPLSL